MFPWDHRLVQISTQSHYESAANELGSLWAISCPTKSVRMSSSRVSGRQLVARPPIVPSSFDKLKPGRFDTFHLFYEDDDANFRYRLHVLDRSVLPTTILSYATAVFLIPAGRESEYMFSSIRGLESILESARCARLIAGTIMIKIGTELALIEVCFDSLAHVVFVFG